MKQVASRDWLTFNKLYGVISQKIEFLITTGVRTSNHTQNSSWYHKFMKKYSHLVICSISKLGPLITAGQCVADWEQTQYRFTNAHHWGSAVIRKCNQPHLLNEISNYVCVSQWTEWLDWRGVHWEEKRCSLREMWRDGGRSPWLQY
jgi:hypothetical protein